MSRPPKTLTWRNSNGQPLANVRGIPGRNEQRMEELAAGIEDIHLGEFDPYAPLHLSPPGSPVVHGPALVPSTTHPGAFKRPPKRPLENRKNPNAKKPSRKARKTRRGSGGSRRSSGGSRRGSGGSRRS